MSIIKDLKSDGRDLENTFPISIFNKKLSILESIVKYFKEERELEYKKISEILNRDSKSIWAIYNNSQKKFKGKLKVDVNSLAIPVDLFSDRKYSASECLISYLKEEKGFRYSKIALLLKRDDRTIWTIYQRYKKKEVKK